MLTKYYGDLDYFRKEFGEAIASRRKDLGLTQKELAQRMGVSQSSVSQTERGESALSLYMIEAFFDALDMSWGIVATPKLANQKYKEKEG